MFKKKSDFGCYVGNVTDKNGKEVFQWKKFKKIFNLNDKVAWAKDFVEDFSIRKIIIRLGVVGLVVGCIYGYGWYQGKQGKPVQFNLAYEKEFHLKLDSHFLHKPKDSHNLEITDAKGNKIKTIRVKDLPELQRKLRPIGFEFEPIGVIGYGVGRYDSGVEGGAGVSFLRYWKWRLESFITNKGIYLGTSYKLTDNSNVGFAGGKGYLGDSRAIVYYRWKFW